MIEVCVSSVEEAIGAQQAGAGRLELCSALEMGGLTPSIGLLKSVLNQVDLPTLVMLRPRPGGFNYDPYEWATICADARELLGAGAAGIVIGSLDSDGQLFEPPLAELVAIASNREVVFHRAFDFLPEPIAAMERLIALGVRRILTSGGQADVLAGIEQLKYLHAQAAGRIEILPGGGIRSSNVAQVLAQTGCRDVHVGASVAITDGSLDHRANLNLCDVRCFEQHRYRRVDLEEIRRVIAQAARPGVSQ